MTATSAEKIKTSIAQLHEKRLLDNKQVTDHCLEYQNYIDDSIVEIKRLEKEKHALEEELNNLSQENENALQKHESDEEKLKKEISSLEAQFKADEKEYEELLIELEGSTKTLKDIESELIMKEQKAIDLQASVIRQNSQFCESLQIPNQLKEYSNGEERVEFTLKSGSGRDVPISLIERADGRIEAIGTNPTLTANMDNKRQAKSFLYKIREQVIHEYS